MQKMKRNQENKKWLKQTLTHLTKRIILTKTRPFPVNFPPSALQSRSIDAERVEPTTSWLESRCSASELPQFVAKANCSSEALRRTNWVLTDLLLGFRKTDLIEDT